MESSNSTKVFVFDSKDKFVHRRESDLQLTGIAIDLWKRVSGDLGINYSMAECTHDGLFENLKNKNADIIVGIMEERQLNLMNVTE